MPGHGPVRYVKTTLRSPLSPVLIATLLGFPAPWTACHSVMPSAIPPVTNGAEGDSSRCRSELGAAVADGAPPPPAASFVFASADCASAAAGAAHWPSALTISSGPTGPWGPRLTFPALVR